VIAVTSAKKVLVLSFIMSCSVLLKVLSNCLVRHYLARQFDIGDDGVDALN